MTKLEQVKETMSILQQRRCRATHIEASPEWMDELRKDLAERTGIVVGDTGNLGKMPEPKDFTHCLGMLLIETAGFGTPQVQWRPDNDRVHQFEYLVGEEVPELNESDLLKTLALVPGEGEG